MSVICAACLGAAAAVAQEAAPAAPAQPEAEKSARPVSPHLAAMLSAGLPKFGEAKSRENKPAPVSGEASGAADKSTNDIIRLPQYLVLEPRALDADAVRTQRGLEAYAVDKYYGPSDSFMRGVLNHYTLGALWQHATKHVPLLKYFGWYDSLEKSAVTRYYLDEAPRKLDTLMRLDALPHAPLPAGTKPTE